MRLTDRQIAKTSCGILIENKHIIGRYNIVNGVLGYECMCVKECDKNDFISEKELRDHVTHEHKGYLES